MLQESTQPDKRRARTPASPPPAASTQDGTYPRPQLVRAAWLDLSGEWQFAFDNDDIGGRNHWWLGALEHFGRRIRVPFPPESAASGIGDPAFHRVIWYRRELDRQMIETLTTTDSNVLLHFGAVDYRADVWLAGHHLGTHEGGQTPFMCDITDVTSALVDSHPDDPWPLVVRAEDDAADASQPRGKQDWQLEPHGIWYARTTGIWQPVWVEAAPSTHITDLCWQPELPNGSLRVIVELNRSPQQPAVVDIQLRFGEDELAHLQITQATTRAEAVIVLGHQVNRLDHASLLWSPESPQLIDAVVRVTADGDVDEVSSYFGLRSVGWADGHFLLNDRPCYLRSVLAQGYWPDSHLAAPSPAALQAEAELIKDLGFNAVRVHQKAEDPRFLYWADRLGLLVWSENASAYEFSTTSVERMTREWVELIRRDRSHPSIVTWVTFNESWGVQNIAHDPSQLHYARALYHLTKAVDPTRLVISNDGWEHAESDIWSIHDYRDSGAELTSAYASAATVAAMLDGIGPLGRRMRLVPTQDRDQPVIVSEFGGIGFATSEQFNAWAYITASDAAEFEGHLREQFAALYSSPVLAGVCYTQLTDTLQEANGLTDALRVPKLPIATIRSIVRGSELDISGHNRPRRPVERPNNPASERPPENLGLRP
jgi:beta-galactosidase/beta-glucuronidase